MEPFSYHKLTFVVLDLCPASRHSAGVTRRIIKKYPRGFAQASQSGVSTQTTRALAKVNPAIQQNLLKDALAECQAALEEFEALRAQWLRYEEQDQPAYFHWLHLHFGPLIQSVHECLEGIQERRRIIDAVERLAVEEDLDYSEAYALFLKNQEQPEFSFESDEIGEEEAFEERMHQGDFHDSREEREGRSPRPGPVHRGPALNPQQRVEFKALYRTLARKLHPDVSDLTADVKARAEALWHQVQEAYEWRDLGRLGSLAILVDSLTNSLTGDAETAAKEAVPRLGVRIADVLASAQGYRRAARSLWRDLNRVRLDPAFGFSGGVKKTSALKRSAQRELEAELTEAQEALAALDQFIEQWSRPVKRRSRKAPLRRSRAGGTRRR